MGLGPRRFLRQSEGVDQPLVSRPRRELSADIVRGALAYVTRMRGPAVAAAVAAAAGITVEDAFSMNRWFATEEVLAVAHHGAAACHEPDFGRRTGEALIATAIESGGADGMRMAGAVEAVLPGVVNAGNKMAASRQLRLVDARPGSAVIEAEWSDPADADPFYCGVAAGSYAALPSVFGTVGAVVESTCQSRGDQVCRFELRWVEREVGAGTEAILGGPGAGNTEILLGRFEQLQDMAARLATAGDVATVLQRITEMVGVAVSAPRHLLAVRATPDSPLRVYQEGWDDPADAEVVAARLDAGDVLDNEAMVPIVSDHRRHGVLAAVFSEATRAGDVERRLLAAYARHAASALSAAASLESARRDRDTASSLLVLARALSELTTQSEVMTALSDVVPTVIGCDHVWVWLWDEEGKRLRLGSTTAPSDIGLAEEILAEDVPGLGDMAMSPRAWILEAESEDGVILDHLQATGTKWCAVVPIQARGDFLGVISAGFVRAVEEVDHQSVVDRMHGLAAQAGVALDNARLLERIQAQAFRDPMTGLPNRPLIEDRSEHALRMASRSGHHVGLLFVDLDRFKVVNDTLGHAAGDQIICQVADRIQSRLRAADTLARLGGDEFVILLADIEGGDDASAAADRIVQSLREPLDFDGRNLFVSCSVGVAVSPEDGESYHELLQHADSAMYEAKAQGKNTFETRAALRTAGRSPLDLEADLHRAIERDELVVLYQPQVDFRTMKIVSVEALMRWDHHELGRLAPDLFLPMAEESGLIVDLDRWVRDQAAQQARTWLDNATPLRIAVNISTRDLRRPVLAAEIGALLARVGLPPHLFELEITDRVVMEEEALPAILEGFHALGVRLAIDDFGTGTSVLGRLQRCPVDVLKIDKGFVQTITAADPDAPVVAALMSLARRLDMEVVAEGVETAFQGGLLRRLGCDLAQGYFFSPPVDVASIDDLMRTPALLASR